MSYFSEAITSIMRVLGSAIDGPHSVVLMSGEGAVGSLDPDSEDGGETAADAEAYGAPGIVWRPRPPEEVSTPSGMLEVFAEAIGLRFGEELRPVAWRDVRWNRRFPAPKPGTIGLVGYGGGFLSLDDASNGVDGSLITLYCPYDFSDGTPGKAMAIVLDPDQQSMMLVHGDGAAVVLDQEGITMRADGSTWTKLSPGRFEVVAASQVYRGNVALGANTDAAIPLMAGMATQPTPSVAFSPV